MKVGQKLSKSVHDVAARRRDIGAAVVPVVQPI